MIDYERSRCVCLVMKQKVFVKTYFLRVNLYGVLFGGYSFWFKLIRDFEGQFDCGILLNLVEIVSIPNMKLLFFES